MSAVRQRTPRGCSLPAQPWRQRAQSGAGRRAATPGWEQEGAPGTHRRRGPHAAHCCGAGTASRRQFPAACGCMRRREMDDEHSMVHACSVTGRRPAGPSRTCAVSSTASMLGPLARSRLFSSQPRSTASPSVPWLQYCGGGRRGQQGRPGRRHARGADVARRSAPHRTGAPPLRRNFPTCWISHTCCCLLPPCSAPSPSSSSSMNQPLLEVASLRASGCRWGQGNAGLVGGDAGGVGGEGRGPLASTAGRVLHVATRRQPWRPGCAVCHMWAAAAANRPTQPHLQQLNSVVEGLDDVGVRQLLTAKERR